MDRCSILFRRPAITAALALVLLAGLGCKSGLQSLGILWYGYEVPAEFDGLKGKKVAVVCKTLTAQEFSNSGAARALAEGISDRLKRNLKDIRIVDPQKIAALVDEKGMEDYVEIGKALKAEKVVAVDIESFGVLDGQTLWRGRAAVTIQVFDVAEKRAEWHKSPPQFEYPSYGSVPATECGEIEFRNQFIADLADRIGRCFYPHDRFDEIGRDADNRR